MSAMNGSRTPDADTSGASTPTTPSRVASYQDGTNSSSRSVHLQSPSRNRKCDINRVVETEERSGNFQDKLDMGVTTNTVPHEEDLSPKTKLVTFNGAIDSRKGRKVNESENEPLSPQADEDTRLNNVVGVQSGVPLLQGSEKLH